MYVGLGCDSETMRCLSLPGLLLQMKTVSVALVLCLNVGVDPPDVVKTSPCARLECWIGERTPPPPMPVSHPISMVTIAVGD